MIKFKRCGIAMGTSALFIFTAMAENTDPTLSPFSTNIVTVDKAITSPSPVKEVPAARSGKVAAAKESQSDVASTTASFGTVSSSDATYTSAIDAHALADALKLTDQPGAFKGTVAKLFEPRGLAIVEFDEDYKTALTAVVRGANWNKFPALTNLIGKKVLITGKFAQFKGAAQIIVDKPDQIKLVQ
jgi:hypothetical protein